MRKFKIYNLQFTILKQNKGLSIIELLMYMGLFAILMTILTQLFVASVESRLESESTSSVDQDANYIFMHLQHVINNADSLDTPAAYAVPAASLSITDNGTVYSYDVQSGNLIRTTGGSSAQLNSYATQVTNFSVERIGNGGNDTFRIQITLESDTQSNLGTETKTFQTTIGRRR